MKTFKAARPKKYYKNENAWLNAVYRKNKKIIDEALSEKPGGPEKAFKNSYKEYRMEKLTPSKSMKYIARSTLFTSVSERLRENAIKALLGGNENEYKILKEATKVKGKYTKIDIEKMSWDKKDEAYVYTIDEKNKVIIKFQPSPKGVNITKITIDKFGKEHNEIYI